MAQGISRGHAEEVYPPLPPLIIDGLMYPPGYRLGIDLAGVLRPGHNKVWVELNSEDMTLLVSFHLRSRGNEEIWWNPSNSDKWKLVSSDTPPNGVRRQLFADLDNDETKRGNAAFFVSFRTDNLSEGLDVRCVGPADLGWVDPTNTVYKRWRLTMEHIIASARFRDPVSVPQLIGELAMAVDFGGYAAAHSGLVLILTPQPVNPGAMPDDQCYITVVAHTSLALSPDEGTIRTRAGLIASMNKLTTMGLWRHLSLNDIDWFISQESDLRRDNLAMTDANGIGQTRGVGINAWYTKPKREETLAVFDDVLKSFRFL
jgi:hypothetical protein